MAGVTNATPPHLPSRRHDRTDGTDYEGLVRQAADGDSAALEALLLAAQHVAYRFSVVACGHADDAEDVMQEALLKTYRHVGRIKQPEFFRTWLYRTVRNACLMKRRLRVDEPRHLQSIDELLPTPDGEREALDPVDPRPRPDDVVAYRRLRRRVQTAMASVPGALRVVLFLREMEGLSTREVAKVLGISEANVKTRLHRARLHLRHALEVRDATR
ncbi:MAG: RNA polymerase sigma factor [Acidobacteriota bacterium]